MNGLNKKRTKKSLFIVKCLLLLSLVLPSVLFSTTVHGDENDQIGRKAVDQQQKKTDEGVGFTVEAVHPETQIDQSKSYYFLRVKPEEEQELTLRIKSTMKAPRTVTIRVNNAFTNKNGAIDYDGKDYKRDKTLKHSLEEMTSVSEEKVTVEKLETKEVKIKITPPKENFTGVKVAAISVLSDEKKDKNQEGLSSTFGYRVGLIVTEEEEVDYDNGQSLNFLDVKPTVHQGKRVIQARFQNPEPKILDDLKIETKLREKGSNEVLRKRTTNDMRMAPNSQFDFSTDWGVDPIKPGTYVLSVRASSNQKSWKWSKEFTIGAEQAKKINEEASYTLTYPSWVPIVVVILGILSISIIGFLYMRRKNWTNTK